MKNIAVVKIMSLIFMAVVTVFLLMGAIKTVFMPEEIKEDENRYANKLAALSAASYADKSFQNSVEDALADQVQFSDEAKTKFNAFCAAVSKPIIRALSANNAVYVRYKGGLCFFKGRLAYLSVALEDLAKPLADYAESVNKIADKYTDVDVYTYYVELDLDVNLESGEKAGLSDCLNEHLNLESGHSATFELRSFEDLDENFYLTDHHWNYKGSYKAYLQLADMLGITDVLKPEGEIVSDKTFAGSRSITAGLSEEFRDNMTIYKFTYPDMEIKINGAAAEDYGNQQAFENGTLEDVSYGSVYGCDFGEIVFDTGSDGENLLVFGDSYDNAILKLLASGFSKTYSIDLRYYEAYMGKEFDFADYMRTNKIDKILFIGDIDSYISNMIDVGD